MEIGGRACCRRQVRNAAVTCREGGCVGFFRLQAVPVTSGTAPNLITMATRSVLPPAYTLGPREATPVILLALLPNPPVPQQPADQGCEAAPSNDRDRAKPLLEDANETHDEYDDRADVLHNDRRVGD